LEQDERRRRFERVALPHLGAAHAFARWLSGDADTASDVEQDAYLRAFRHFDSFRGGAFRPWLLAIVRNSFVTGLARQRSAQLSFAAEPLETDEPLWSEPAQDPETQLLRRLDGARVATLLARLPLEFREVLVLREVEDLSYAEIARIAEIPIGTVMSRLARARRRLRELWLAAEAVDEMR
jgi:RNA polymerase sigma factor (sigma-70 family)